jgi:hypothetical protein
MDARDYIGKPRDTVREHELARKLRELPTEEAHSFIVDYIAGDPVVGLILANRVLRSNEHFREILKDGLEQADASTIKFWLECCLPRLGPMGLVQTLIEAAESNPAGAELTVYWLEFMLRGRTEPVKQESQKLVKAVGRGTV